MSYTFNDLATLEPGARFVTADLHVHTLGGSADVTDPLMTVEAIIDAAADAGIGLLAIADHNSDRNIVNALAYGAKYAERLLVLPGVEVTTANGHLLLYGDPATPDSISVLLAKLDLVGGKGERDTHTKKSMADVIAEGACLGLLSFAAHVDREHTGFERLAEGYPNWKRDILLAPGLYGLEFDESAHLVWFSRQDEAGDAGCQRRSLIEVRNQTLPGIGRPGLASIQNSDAHVLAHFRDGLSSRALTRYKMTELTFEGFRTAVTDPESRVRPIAIIPPSIPRVRGVHVTGGFLDGEAYRFSDNLNTFIGGRGTGKSTAIRSVAYGLGRADDFADQDNCPDTVTVYCEDASGVLYRFERQKGASAVARSKIGKSIQEVPLDSFRVEYYGQGELAEVAKDPLKNPALLQEFLDRHIVLADLNAREAAILEQLQNNSAELIPLEGSARQMQDAQATLRDIETKLLAAREGKLEALVDLQTKINGEKSLVQGFKDFATSYEAGVSLKVVKRDAAGLFASVGTLTGDAKCEEAFKAATAAVSAANEWIDEQESVFNRDIKGFATLLRETLNVVPTRHAEWEEQITKNTDLLRAKGLSGGIAQLGKLMEQRSQHVKTITRLNAQTPALDAARNRRRALLDELRAVRDEIADRRKAQLVTINHSFKETIEDYAIYLYYDPSGICAEFVTFILNSMQGTHFPQKVAERMCQVTSPDVLASCVSQADVNGIAAFGEVGTEWARMLVDRLGKLHALHQLQMTPKPRCPMLKVLTKTTPQVQIPVNQLSD
jgi:hypothetical protein